MGQRLMWWVMGGVCVCPCYVCAKIAAPIGLLRTGSFEMGVPLETLLKKETAGDVRWLSELRYVDHFAFRHLESITLRSEAFAKLGKLKQAGVDQRSTLYDATWTVDVFASVTNYAYVGFGWSVEKNNRDAASLAASGTSLKVRIAW